MSFIACFSFLFGLALGHLIGRLYERLAATKKVANTN